MSELTVASPAQFVKKDVIAEIRAELARANLKHGDVASRVGLSAPKFSKLLNHKLRMSSDVAESIRNAVVALRTVK